MTKISHGAIDVKLSNNTGAPSKHPEEYVRNETISHFHYLINHVHTSLSHFHDKIRHQDPLLSQIPMMQQTMHTKCVLQGGQCKK